MQDREWFTAEEVQEATNIGFGAGVLTGMIATVALTAFAMWAEGWI